MSKLFLTKLIVLALSLAWFLLPSFSPAQGLQLISTVHPSKIPSAGGDADSMGPILSADGRYALFASSAQNLVVLGPAPSGPPMLFAPLNVFMRDRTNGTTTLN